MPRLTVNQRLYCASGVVALILIAMRITPSSYGVALGHLGAHHPGLIAFEPRPIRSDEWAVITPAIQATINNGFERYNKTSFYHEDLRQVYSLPVRDWGFAFKPTMWLFGVASASVAFATHHVVLQVLFLVGFALIFRRSGLVGYRAWLLAACIFWSGFVQYFWTAVGPVVAWWPWLTLAIIWVRTSWLAIPVVAYAFACWTLSFFYPPLFISLGFVTACFVFGFRHNRLPPLRLLACGIACIVGAGVAIYYLRDTLLVLNETIYPGQRRVAGGGLYAEKIVSMFLPYAFISRSEPFGVRASIDSVNICEFGVVGSVYFLFALLVFSPSRMLSGSFKPRRSELVVLVIGCSAVLAWMLVPIPSRVGAVLLWDRVPGFRMVMAAGVLFALISVYVFRHASTRMTLPRMAIGLAIILAFVAWKSSHGVVSLRLIGRDLLPAVGLIGVYALRARLSPSGEHATLLATAALMNLLCFGTFNPLQQADPIFTAADTPVARQFAEHARRQHGRPLLDEFPGRVLNGLGFSSIAHVEAVPQMQLWRDIFPDLSETELSAFNQYAHIILSDEEEKPRSRGDVVLLPKRAVLPRLSIEGTCTPSAVAGGGTVARVERSPDGRIVVRGHVAAAGVFRDQVLRVVTPYASKARLDVTAEPGVAVDLEHDQHDFTLTLETGPGEHTGPVCLLFVDERLGTTAALDDPSLEGECDACLRHSTTP